MRSILVFLFIPFYTFSQTDSLLFKEIYIVEGDTFITAEIQSVDILSFKTDNDKRYYDRLKRKTLKVYPYALLAAYQLDSIQQELIKIPKTRCFVFALLIFVVTDFQSTI